MEYIIKNFHELSKDELYNILKLRNKVFIVEQNCPYQDCDGKDPESFHLIVKSQDSDRIAGYLRIVKKANSSDQVSITRVLVDQEYRRNGIAREMMTRAIEFIEKNLNEKEIKLSGQEYLTGFYESLAFKVVSEMYLEDGIPHLEMLYRI